MPSSTYKIRKALKKSELNAPFEDADLVYFMDEDNDEKYVYLTLYEEQEKANQLRIKKSKLPKEQKKIFSTTLFNLADQKQKRKDKQHLFGLISQTTFFIGISASAIILLEFFLSFFLISFFIASGLAALIIPFTLTPVFIYSLGKFYHTNTASKIKGSILALSTGTIVGAIIGLAVFLFGFSLAGFSVGIGIGLSMGIGAVIGLLASSLITLSIFFHAKSLETLAISDVSTISVHKDPETNTTKILEKTKGLFYRHFDSYSDIASTSSEIDPKTTIIRKGNSHQGWFHYPRKKHENVVHHSESNSCSSLDLRHLSKKESDVSSIEDQESEGSIIDLTNY